MCEEQRTGGPFMRSILTHIRATLSPRLSCCCCCWKRECVRARVWDGHRYAAASSETRVRFIHSFTFSLETHSVKSLLSSLEITTITINVAVRWMVAGTRPARIESDSLFVSTRWWLLIIIMEIKISTLVGRSRPERTLLTTTRGH